MYPSFTALYDGCRSQRVTNSNQYTSTANRRPTTLHLSTDSLKSTKIKKKKKNTEQTKQQRIKRLNGTKKTASEDTFIRAHWSLYLVLGDFVFVNCYTYTNKDCPSKSAVSPKV